MQGNHNGTTVSASARDSPAALLLIAGWMLAACACGPAVTYEITLKDPTLAEVRRYVIVNQGLPDQKALPVQVLAPRAARAEALWMPGTPPFGEAAGAEYSQGTGGSDVRIWASRWGVGIALQCEVCRSGTMWLVPQSGPIIYESSLDPLDADGSLYLSYEYVIGKFQVAPNWTKTQFLAVGVVTPKENVAKVERVSHAPKPGFWSTIGGLAVGTAGGLLLGGAIERSTRDSGGPPADEIARMAVGGGLLAGGLLLVGVGIYRMATAPADRQLCWQTTPEETAVWSGPVCGARRGH